MCVFVLNMRPVLVQLDTYMRAFICTEVDEY